MLNIKYKLISATMGIALLASTGVASIVHASPVNQSPINPRSEVIYRQYHESFTTQLDWMVATGFLSSYQESRVFDAFNARENFNARLNNLVETRVISGYQASRILEVFNNSAEQNNFVKPNNFAQPKAPESALTQPIAPTLPHK
jgi:hypothetical protein